MSREIKRLPIREFRELGFLQEANRQFFHPHGLALEITHVKDAEGAPLHSVCFSDDEYQRLVGLVADDAELKERITNANHYEVGDCWLSGVWDDRDDPEGVVFGDLSTSDRGGGFGHEHAARVAEERAKHREHRTELFAGARHLSDLVVGADIEPLDWIYPETA